MISKFLLFFKYYVNVLYQLLFEYGIGFCSLDLCLLFMIFINCQSKFVALLKFSKKLKYYLRLHKSEPRWLVNNILIFIERLPYFRSCRIIARYGTGFLGLFFFYVLILPNIENFYFINKQVIGYTVLGLFVFFYSVDFVHYCWEIYKFGIIKFNFIVLKKIKYFIRLLNLFLLCGVILKIYLDFLVGFIYIEVFLIICIICILRFLSGNKFCINCVIPICNKIDIGVFRVYKRVTFFMILGNFAIIHFILYDILIIFGTFILKVMLRVILFFFFWRIFILVMLLFFIYLIFVFFILIIRYSIRISIYILNFIFLGILNFIQVNFCSLRYVTIFPLFIRKKNLLPYFYFERTVNLCFFVVFFLFIHILIWIDKLILGLINCVIFFFWRLLFFGLMLVERIYIILHYRGVRAGIHLRYWAVKVFKVIGKLYLGAHIGIFSMLFRVVRFVLYSIFYILKLYIRCVFLISWVLYGRVLRNLFIYKIFEYRDLRYLMFSIYKWGIVRGSERLGDDIGDNAFSVLPSWWQDQRRIGFITLLPYVSVGFIRDIIMLGRRFNGLGLFFSPGSYVLLLSSACMLLIFSFTNCVLMGLHILSSICWVCGFGRFSIGLKDVVCVKFLKVMRRFKKRVQFSLSLCYRIVRFIIAWFIFNLFIRFFWFFFYLPFAVLYDLWEFGRDLIPYLRDLSNFIDLFFLNFQGIFMKWQRHDGVYGFFRNYFFWKNVSNDVYSDIFRFFLFIRVIHKLIGYVSYFIKSMKNFFITLLYVVYIAYIEGLFVFVSNCFFYLIILIGSFGLYIGKMCIWLGRFLLGFYS